MKIEYISSSDGEWYVVKLDGEVYYSGHSVPDWVWLKLLSEQKGVKVLGKEISWEQMERQEY